MSEPVTPEYPTKDVYEDRLYVLVSHEYPESVGYLLNVGTTSYIKEVCRFSTGELHDVHGSHGKTRSVDHATYVPAELDVVEIVLVSLHLKG